MNTVPMGLCRGSPRSEGRYLADSALMPIERSMKEQPSFVDSIPIKDIVKDTMWITHPECPLERDGNRAMIKSIEIWSDIVT